MKSIAFIIISICFIKSSLAQLTVVSNDATTIYLENSAVLYIEGNIENENTGVFDNSGIIHFSGDWTNNASNTGFTPTSNGTIRMFGNTQAIGGTSSTTFYDLILDGGATTKNLLIDGEVSNSMDLVDAELQTNDNIMHVSNPSVNAITWNTGYVSSDILGGYLSRSTNSTSNYIYPVGSSALSNIYRAVEITPQTTSNNTFAVRVAPINPTYDIIGTSSTGATGGFNTDTKNLLLGNINDLFYHNIARISGTDAADVNVNYFSSDGDFKTMAQWGNATNQWENTTFSNSPIFGANNIGAPDMISSISLNANFNHDVFALSNIFGVNIPQFISPDGNGKNDVLIIENIKFYPDNVLKVFNRYGNIVYKQNGYNNDWDGTVGSDANMIYGYTDGSLPSGTYFYILDLGISEIEPYTGYIQIQK